MKAILERLIIATEEEASNPSHYRDGGIQAVLSLKKPDDSGDIKFFPIFTLNDGSVSPDALADGIDFLRESLRAGRKVLAVGTLGATIVVAYLAEMGMSHRQALDLVGHDYHLAPDPAAISVHEKELERRGSQSIEHI